MRRFVSNQREFEEEIFENLDFELTQLLDFNFQDCLFKFCKFTNVNFYGSKLQNVRFQDCKLTGIDFSVISKFLTEMHFENSVLEVCTFANQKLIDLSFSNSIVKECDFDKCDLQKVVFNETDLKGTTFIDCDLRQADFRSAKNYFFELKENKVKGALFSFPEVLSFLSPFGLKIS